MSINEYVRKMQEIYNVLTASGQVISEEELSNFILDGLGGEYDLAKISCQKWILKLI